MKQIVFCLLLLLLCEIFANKTWDTYKSKHRKRYSKREDAVRQARYMKVDSMIKEHNKKFAKGHVTYTMGHNKFSDMTRKEIMHRLGKRKVKPYRKSSKAPGSAHKDLPPTYDLRASKCMPAIKNQGICGSCWAFAATNPIEYQKCLKTGTLVTLSEQAILDCTYAPTYNGCNGGDHRDAWYYIYKSGGQQPASTYSYASGGTGKDTSCKFAYTKVNAKLANAGIDLPQNETAIQAALVSNGPITFAYYVTNNFFYYKSGVFSDTSCKSDVGSLNHEMVIVGYGVLNNVPYWIVRNQWGTGWGQSGYAFIRRNTNECGIAIEAGYPIVA